MIFCTSIHCQRLVCLALLFLCYRCNAWMMPKTTTTTPSSPLSLLSKTAFTPVISSSSSNSNRLQIVLQSSTSVNSQVTSSSEDKSDKDDDKEKEKAENTDIVIGNNDDEDDEDDDDEFEYIEYDMLTEAEFMGSEWLVGTVLNNNQNKIIETWCRLVADKDGKNVAIWGDKSEGTWAWDVANQFLSFSKNSLIGKEIWACVVDDYYYMQGTVRGWNFFSPAAVLGQWQAKRLGVDPDEAGPAPWFENDTDDDDDNNKKTKKKEEKKQEKTEDKE